MRFIFAADQDGDHKISYKEFFAFINRFVEEETTAKVFDVMWPLTEGCRVMKRRYSVPDGALTWVVDEFLDRELVLAEVELPSTEVVPAIPDWMAPVLVREVTGEDEYVNLNLAR